MEIKQIKDEANKFMIEVKKVYDASPYILKRIPVEGDMPFFKDANLQKFAKKIINYKDQSYVYKIIASMYVYNPLCIDKEDMSLAKSFKLYRTKSGSKSFEQRFEVFLRSYNRESIFKDHNILNMAKMLKDRDIPINYEKLFCDLWLWGDSVKKRYMIDFYTEEEVCSTEE